MGGKKSVVLELYKKQVMSVIYPTVDFVRNNLMLTPFVGVALGAAPRVIIKNRKVSIRREMQYE
jgi:hypothetical protein